MPLRPHVAYEFLVLRESDSLLIHAGLEHANLFETFWRQVLALFDEGGNLAENLKTRALGRTLQRIVPKERYNRLLDIALSAYGVAITLTMIGALLLLEVDLAAPYRVPHPFEQRSVSFLHLQMKMQLEPIPRPIPRRFAYIYIEASFPVRKANHVFVADFRKYPSHTPSIT